MKKRIILLGLLMMISLCGCRNQGKTYGNVYNWDELNSTSDTEHVYFVMSENGFYSDGSWDSNQLYNDWVREYEETH